LGKMRKTKEEKGLMGRRDKARFNNLNIFCFKLTYSAS